MTDGTAQFNQFQPLHSGHAIEQVVLAVQFDRGLDDAAIKAAYDAVAGIAIGDLPKHAQISGMALIIGAPPMPMPPLAPSFSGYVFQKIRPDGLVERELRVERASIIFRTLAYTRWAEVWGQARSYIAALISSYATNAGISAVMLSYVDKFVWQGPMDQSRASQLLQPGSPYLCPHVYAADDLWHSHTGAYIRVDAATKRLLNVNVDYLDETLPKGASRVIAITTILTDMFNQTGYERSTVDQDTALAFVECHLEQMHDFDKTTLAAIISEEMSRRIALTD